MKILIISTVRYRSNGISNVIRNLYTNKVFKQDEIDFFFPEHCDESMVDELISFKKRKVIISKFPRNNIIKYFNYIKKIVSKNKYDIVHIHGNSHTMCLELLAAKLAGCNVRIAHCHNTTCNSRFLNFLLTPLFNFSCNFRFACGVDAGKWLYKRKSFTIINNGIDTGKFQFNYENRQNIRAQIGLTNEIIICHVGNFNEQKNQKFLIDIFSELYKSDIKYRLMLIGEGYMRVEMENKVNSLGLSDVVYFIGKTNNVSAYLSAADMIVMPSLYEGLPLTLIEEQANGLVCVVSDTITKESDKTGLLTFVPLDNIEKWKNAISGISFTDRNVASKNAINSIRSKGYSIDCQAVILRNQYANMKRL